MKDMTGIVTRWRHPWDPCSLQPHWSGNLGPFLPDIIVVLLLPSQPSPLFFPLRVSLFLFSSPSVSPAVTHLLSHTRLHSHWCRFGVSSAAARFYRWSTTLKRQVEFSPDMQKAIHQMTYIRFNTGGRVAGNRCDYRHGNVSTIFIWYITHTPSDNNKIIHLSSIK